MTLIGTPYVEPQATDKPQCDITICQTSCELIFDIVHVSYLIRGETRIVWLLKADFADPLPWLFQLQVGTNSGAESDWTDVGLPIENSCHAIDSEPREFSKEISTHYRVKVTTAVATYYSPAVSKSGILSARDWRLAQEIIRKEKLRARYASQEGYLLKRRLSGANCGRCLDLMTDEVTDPNCPECRGTGKSCGYYYPMSCIWADISPAKSTLQQDPTGMRGTTQDMVASARMLMLPIISEYDIWVNHRTDERYVIRSVQNIAEMRGVPLIASAELRLLPFTDVAYTIDIPEQSVPVYDC